MLGRSLEDLTEADLIALGKEQIPESIRLEFKRQLNLESDKDKAEAAKDVSAMANTVGGRIFYGIDEVKLSDQRKVAGAVTPITDGDAASRLENVLVSTIHPRPRFRPLAVPVAGGYVLVVEVYPSFAGDLHMVTGFNEYRFYRRGEQRAIRMEESEIREAYTRIAASRQVLEASLEAAIEGELRRVPKTQQSVIVVPWFGRRDLADPRKLGRDLGVKLANGPLRGNSWQSVAPRLQIQADGYRTVLEGRGDQDAEVYLAINRTGLIHFADTLPPQPQPGEHHWIHLIECVEAIVAALVAARHVLDAVEYWGPVRVIHELRPEAPCHLIGPQEDYGFVKRTRAPGARQAYRQQMPEVNLREYPDVVGMICRELLDQLFQIRGNERCPWFDEGGRLVNNVIRQELACKNILECLDSGASGSH